MSTESEAEFLTRHCKQQNRRENVCVMCTKADSYTSSGSCLVTRNSCSRLILPSMVFTSAVYGRLQDGICRSAILCSRYASPVLGAPLSDHKPWLKFSHLEHDSQQSSDRPLWFCPSWYGTFWFFPTTSTTFQMIENEVARKAKLVPAFFFQWTRPPPFLHLAWSVYLFLYHMIPPNRFDVSLMPGYMCASVCVQMWFLASKRLISTLQMSNNFIT